MKTRAELKKLHPQFKGESSEFYHKILADQMQLNLGIVSKEKIKQGRLREEIERAEMVSANIKKQLKNVMMQSCEQPPEADSFDKSEARNCESI